MLAALAAPQNESRKRLPHAALPSLTFVRRMPAPSKPQPFPGTMTELRSERHSSLPALLEDSLTRQRRQAAVIDANCTLRYEALERHSRALAAWLLAQGFDGGERVAVMLPNVAQFVVTAFAVLRAGLVLVNLDPQLTRRELVQQLRDCGARAIVAMQDAATMLEGALHNAPLDLVVLAREDDFASPLIKLWRRPPWRREPPARIAGVVAFARALREGRRIAFAPPTLQPQAMALLQYSGGTTGAAKAAVLTHRNLVANVLQCIAWQRPALAQLPPTAQVVMLVATPLHDIFGFTLGALLGLRLGAALCLSDDAAGGAAAHGLRRLVHVVLGTDTSLAALARSKALTRSDWAALRLTIGTGVPLTTEVQAQWLARTGCHVSIGYGLAEASPWVTFNAPGSASRGAGTPLPATEVKLLDDLGRPAQSGATGEIGVRGPQVMAGYWQRPEDTAAVMTPEGYLRTGDLGRIDEAGHLILLDRKKDLIVVGGFRIVPAEIELVVSQIPGVRECAVVGVPDPRRGQVIKVVVVKEDPESNSPSHDEISRYCEHHLSGHMRPRVVEFVAALPRTSGGRVLRRELRAAA